MKRWGETIRNGTSLRLKILRREKSSRYATRFTMSDPLEKIYNDLLEHSMHLIKEHDLPLEAVAGSLMAIAMRLYRTQLSDEDFNRLRDVILDTPIEPFKPRKLH